MAGPFRAERLAELHRNLPYEDGTGHFRFHEAFLATVQSKLRGFCIDLRTPSNIFIPKLAYPQDEQLDPRHALHETHLEHFPVPVLVAKKENVYPNPLMILSLNPHAQEHGNVHYTLSIDTAVRKAKVKVIPLPRLFFNKEEGNYFIKTWLTSSDIPDGLFLPSDVSWVIGPDPLHMDYNRRLIVAVTPTGEVVLSYMQHYTESLIRTKSPDSYQLPPELMPKPAPAAAKPDTKTVAPPPPPNPRTSRLLVRGRTAEVIYKRTVDSKKKVTKVSVLLAPLGGKDEKKGKRRRKLDGFLYKRSHRRPRQRI